MGGTPDEAAIVRGEKAIVAPLSILEHHLAKNRWILGASFSLVDCDYGPTLNALEKASFSLEDFPKTKAYVDAIRERPAWQATPKLPML